MVLSLAYYAAYDPVTPGAMTPAVASDLLRDEPSFKGVAITDDLGAGAVMATERVPQAAVEAIAAGADMVQIDELDRQRGVREALLRAVREGGIPSRRLADAARQDPRAQAEDRAARGPAGAEGRRLSPASGVASG